MIVCEYEFNDPDPKNPDYSFLEIDFYAGIPYTAQRKYNIPDHRLSLRKNLRTGEFEVYRFYHQTKEIEVVFKSKNLQEALNFANRECVKYNRFNPNDQACQHRPPILSSHCPIYKNKQNK